ncbi:tRNA (guanosine(37)-N1)-methyltransferase TrmD [Candidatus Peregrinibacteria bacterium]|nr:tRNA (guanosine(37)-N1)-methyltransferase TrmD [Candidatus Peregrinibacteria bacterium]
MVPSPADNKKIHFSVLTIFPHSMDSYCNESILRRAIQKKIIKLDFYDIRKYSKNKHRKVDDKPYGGGSGMIMTPEPLYNCILAAKKGNKGPVIFLTPHGKIFTHRTARRLSNRKEMILLCGRYEGIDQRIRDTLVDEEISIGKYVLTGGELPAMILIDALTRLLPNVLGDEYSALEDSFTPKLKGKKEYPHYTKPAIFHEMKVPEILRSGNHKKIEEWRMSQLK